MLNREAILRTIDDAYATRMGKSREALANFWAPDASFRLAADLSALPISNYDDPMTGVGEIIDQFEISDLSRREAIVEGNKAAVHWDVTVQVRDKAPVRTQLMDLIEFDEDGRIKSFTQFADTALMAALFTD